MKNNLEIPKELLDLVHDCIESGYNEGYKNGVTHGEQDAWDCIKECAHDMDKTYKVFGERILTGVLDNNEPSEAIAKLKNYQESILGKIRNEIIQKRHTIEEIEDDYDRGRDCGLSMAIEIIDKYEEESEEK